MDAWEDARDVLCVRLDTLGDVLMTTPALRAVKEGRAGRRVTLLTSPAGAVTGRLVPEVDDVIVYDAPWMKSTTRVNDPAPDLAMIETLRARHFDACVIFTVHSQNPAPAALLASLAGIPLRLAHCRENVYGLLTHRVPETEPQEGVRHEVRRQLDLVRAVGMTPGHERLSVRPTPEHHRNAEEALRDLDVGARPWVLVHPGATAESRRYPAPLYADVVRGLVMSGHDVILTGGPDEVGLVEDIRSRSGVRTHSLAGRLDLGSLCALIARAPLVVTNNTGPAHVAAATMTPVVDLYALTNPQHTPWLVPSRVLNHPVPCANCLKSVCPEGHHLCLRGVPPGAVVEAALDLLAAHPTRERTPA